MKTRYLDDEIERLNLLERIDELTDCGKEMLSELKEIKQALFIPRVSNRKELLFAFAEYWNGCKNSLIEESNIDEFLKSK